MARKDWFKCYPVDFLQAFQKIGNAEQAIVYVVVCFKIYAAGGPVPARADSFQSESNLTVFKVQRAIEALVEQGRLVFIGTDLMNPRADEVLAERNAISETRSAVGKGGGRPRKNAAKSSDDARGMHVTGTSQVRGDHAATQTQLGFGEEMAENSHSQKPIAKHEKSRGEESREEKNPPHPQKQRGRFMPDMPDFGPSEPRSEPLAEVVPIAPPAPPKPAPPAPAPVEKPDLIAWIMTQAKMAVPPGDMALVGGWVEMGLDVEREIKPTVCRMVANARTPPRGMRYFDTELRTIYDVRIAKEASDRAGFAAIRQRYAG